MLTPPDPQRQYVATLSQLIGQGNSLFERYKQPFFYLWHSSHADQAKQCSDDFNAWIDQVFTTLRPSDYDEFRTILVDGRTPSWEQAWDIVIGRVAYQGTANELYEISHERIMKRFLRLLDYIKALRLSLAPLSPLSADFYHQFAQEFHRMNPYTIDEFFINSGCVIHYWIPPYKPQKKQTADRAYGWLDGLNLYMPDSLVGMVEAAYQAYRDYKRFPRELPLDHIQVALRDLKSADTKPSPLARYQLHPRVVERATPFWRIDEYDTALSQVCIALDNAVQAHAGLDSYGTALMRAAFSPKQPLITVNPRFGNQQGFMDLFAGVMDAIRNPRAHHHHSNLSADEAIEWLAFLSALFRVLDAATVNQSDQP